MTALAFDIDIAIARPGRRIDVRIASTDSLVALVGPSGMGKTSVLDAIAGLLRPAHGHIEVGGTRLFDAAAQVDMPPERRGAGYVFQDSRLFPHLSVGQNLAFGTRYADGRAPFADAAECAELLGIGHLLHRRPRELSGGEIRRAAIARALLRAPRFLLLDEPTASLDDARRQDILRIVEQIRDRFALPILYVSHDRSEVDRLAGLVVEL